MNLYIIRHAIAVEPGTPGYEEDSLRPLTTKGSEKMTNIARGLKSLDVRFDLILSSPYTRALETAQILLKVLKMKKEQLAISEHLTPMSLPDEVIGEINEKYPHVESIALVGHEPHLSALIGLLVAGDTGIAIEMRKGGVCFLTAENLRHERRATLEWLMMPKHLVALGERE
ncbi:MAG: phosphohistidine phosphatase SixA [Anaerolineales bacterium]|nr:phosphohistidine phosphatase SixA [Anaerolineales bacterium]MCX7756595.1 phosphohistidine phosphatase SixA [Anaerolineales bacterium]MDW8277853.1 phosphohistidine phosphatase SixA [Anaerolineales bacterium]